MLGNVFYILQRQGIASWIVRVANHSQRCLGIIYLLDKLPHIQAIILFIQVYYHRPGLGSLGIYMIHREGWLWINNSQIPAAKGKKQLLNDFTGAIANKDIFLLQSIIISNGLHELLQILIRITVKGYTA